MLDKVLMGALLVVLLISQAASAPILTYSVQRLPELSPRNGYGSRYTAYLGFEGMLNDKGQVVATLNDRPVIWSNGTITSLDNSIGNAMDINNSGQVMISSGVDFAAPEGGSCHFWSNGILTGMGSLNNGDNACWPTAMNAAGQVIGISYVVDGNGIFRGRGVFLWSNGVMTNLDPYDNFRYGEFPCYGIYEPSANPCTIAVNDQTVDVNDKGQVLFIQRHNTYGPSDPIDPVPDGPVVWSNGKKIPLPQSVNFGKGKSINNQGDVLGYLSDNSFLIWNVNDGSSYQYDSDISLYNGSSASGSGGVKLTNSGDVYFPRSDGIYKLTKDRIVQKVVSLGGGVACTTNQIIVASDQWQIVGGCGDSFVIHNGVATSFKDVVFSDPTYTVGAIFSINNAGQVWASNALLTPVTQNIASCDANQDSRVDKTDLWIIFAANRTANPSYDIDGDGVVTVRDMRKCVLQCAHAECVP